MMNRASRRVAAVLGVWLLLSAATACTDDTGDVVTILSPESERDLQSLRESFESFTATTGIEVDVQGSPSFETDVESRIRVGNPPDIAMFPQPGNIVDLATEISDLPDEARVMAERNFDPALTELVTVDGELKAIPVKANLKSLVWYSPEVFATAGYEIPETFEQFLTMTDRMVADGNPPFCVGLESGSASGWPFTDWVEDFLLRLHGPEVYDRWTRHEIPFDDPAVVEAAEMVVQLWSRDGVIFGGTDAAAVTSYTDAGLPLLAGECMMYRQASFYALEWPEGTELGPGGDIDAFSLPGSEEHPKIALTSGIYAAAFSGADEVGAVMDFLASTDYANARAGNEIGGYLSPNRFVDVGRYRDELMRGFGETLATADPVRFDASDLMPGTVGSGSFWSAALDITTGAEDVATAFAQVEEHWPPPE